MATSSHQNITNTGHLPPSPPTKSKWFIPVQDTIIGDENDR